MDIVEHIKPSVANRGDEVFLRGEFDRFGNQAQVGRALNRLKQPGTLVRLGVGVYVKAKPSVLSGRPIPNRPPEVLAPAALVKLGIAAQPGRLTQSYNSGRSTQVPAGIAVNVGRRRVVRKLGFNGKLVRYERT